MPIQPVQAYETYLIGWSAVSDSERERVLRECLSEKVVLTVPSQERREIEGVAAHLKEFQAGHPGDSFRLNNLIGWGAHALAEWQWIDTQGNAGMTGYDVLTFDEQGRILTILIFANIEEQKLAWRRREAVELAITA